MEAEDQSFQILLIDLKNNQPLTVTDPRMTRFNINLDQAINLVYKSLKFSKSGEIYVPKIQSFKITDLVKAISGSNKFETIGIRPGEKLHEELVSIYEGYSTVEFKDYYAILSSNDKKVIDSIVKKIEQKVEKGFCYTSNNNPIF